MWRAVAEQQHSSSAVAGPKANDSISSITHDERCIATAVTASDVTKLFEPTGLFGSCVNAVGIMISIDP